MRSAVVSLIALAGFAPMALAQTAPPPADSASAAPASAAPAAAAPAVPASAAPAVAASPAAPTDSTPLLGAPAFAEGPPPPPPPPPTDPAAVALLNTLETVCIPSAGGGNLAQNAKAAGYKKSGDNFVYKQADFQFTVLAPGSNPTQCHVDLVHPVYPDAPAKPLVIALHNWAVLTHGWKLYRNDKNVEAGQEFTTRSWEHDADGKSEALVITTVRKADGTPSQRNADTSMMIYSVTKSGG